MANHGGKIGEILLHIRDVFVFVAGDGQRIFQSGVYIRRRHFTLIRMRKFLHGADDVRDALESIQAGIERYGRVVRDISDIGLGFRVAEFGQELRVRRRSRE